MMYTKIIQNERFLLVVKVSNFQELKEANVADNSITVSENIQLEEPIVLESGVQLEGESSSFELTGTGKLIVLTENNTLKNITLRTNKNEDGVSFKEQGVKGQFTLENVTTYGLVCLTADDAAGDIRIDITDVDVVEANVTHKSEGPTGFWCYGYPRWVNCLEPHPRYSFRY